MVTPCVGVWIEIQLPSNAYNVRYVTPCVGVWIEIANNLSIVFYAISHSLRGSVD